MEVWTDIKGYEGYYQISNLGNVKSLPRVVMSAGRPIKRVGKLLKQYRGTDGYVFVRLCKLGKAKYWRSHRLVAIHFIENPNDYPAVNHLDADVTNNQASNLEWCTIKQNNKHTYTLGRNNNPSGAAHWKAKLTDIKANAIKHLLKTDMPMTEIAAAVDTTYQTVKAIKQGRAWVNKQP